MMDKLIKTSKNKLALLMVLTVLLQLVSTTLESIQFDPHPEQLLTQDHHHDLSGHIEADDGATLASVFIEKQVPELDETCDNCHDCHGGHFALFLQIDTNNLSPLSGFLVGYISGLISTPSESLFRPPIV
jgi:hypothetical protein